MIWKADSYPVHICGSVHILHKKQKKLIERYENYLRSAEHIAFETDLTQSSLIDNTLLYYPSGLKIQNDIPNELYKKAKQLWDLYGIIGIEFDLLKPCTAATWMFLNYAEKRGYNEANGIDQALLTRAKKIDSKNLIQLEDINAPLRAFDTASKEEQIQYLETVTCKLKDQFRELETMIQCIIHSNIEWLRSYLENNLKLYPTLFNNLVIERNRNWLPKLLDVIKFNQPVLIVVGALHCVGTSGLPNLLLQKGIQFRLIED